MAKFGTTTKKKSVHASTHAETVAHKHVPGRAFEVSNPSDKLIHIIGGGFFNEPHYYDTKRSYASFCAEWMAQGGKITSRILDEAGLTEQARDVIQTMKDVAESNNPEDLLIIAAWARDKKNGLKIRTTPNIALALAAANDRTKPFVCKYATSIMLRADEPRQVFAAFRHLFTKKVGGLHKGTLPHCLRKALAEAYASYSPYELLKWNSPESPTHKDVLLMVQGMKKLPRRYRKNKQGLEARQEDGYPLSKAMFDYIVNNKISDDLPEIVTTREYFFKKVKNVKDVTPDLLEKAGLTWENVLSHFGSKKESWEVVIPMMDEMALTRNLRNFEEAKISKESWDKIYKKCEKLKDSVQLPFRFFTAERETSSTDAKTAVSIQCDNAVKNLPDLDGVTVILVDNSGSATGTPVSGKSDLRISDTGNMLAAVAAKRFGRRAIVGVFGDSLIWVPFNATDSTISIKKMIDAKAQTEDRTKNNALAFSQYKRGCGVGGGTETGLWWGIHDLTERKVHVDRFVLLSDLCCYTQADNNCGVNMTKAFGKDGENATVESMFRRYRRTVNKDCHVYSVNLAGYAQAQTDSNDKSHLMSGWSEQIFALMADIEGNLGRSQDREAKPDLPTIEALRARYKK